MCCPYLLDVPPLRFLCRHPQELAQTASLARRGFADLNTLEEILYHHGCSLADLRRPPRGAPDYVSVRVRPDLGAPPLPDGPSASAAASTSSAPSLAILTLAVPLQAAVDCSTVPCSDVRCALPQWCERAALLARAVRSEARRRRMATTMCARL